MISEVNLSIEPIAAAGNGKLVNLEWACERERLSFGTILRHLRRHPQKIRIFQDTPSGAMLVSSPDFAAFADSVHLADDIIDGGH